MQTATVSREIHPSYVQPWPLGAPLYGAAIGVVVASEAPAFRAEAARWLRDGALIARETVVEGLEAMPDAFLGLYRGDNIGKMVVRVGDAR